MRSASESLLPTLRGDGLSGGVALVTGAAQGIGAAVADVLASRDVSVAIADINEPAAESKAQQIRANGGAASAIGLDVTMSDLVDRVVNEVEERLGPISVLVNNAGLCQIGASTAVSDREWTSHIDVMLNGPFWLSRTVGRRMLERGAGAIVNVCSIGAFGGHPMRAAYNASKGGLKLLTEVLAVEWAARGVRVNAIAPGVTRTEILADVLRSGQGHIRTDDFERRTPMGRLAETWEVAECVAFLASSRASYLTGETLVVDGGWLASEGFAFNPAEGAAARCGSDSGTLSRTRSNVPCGDVVMSGGTTRFVDSLTASLWARPALTEVEKASATEVLRELPNADDRCLAWLHIVPSASATTSQEVWIDYGQEMRPLVRAIELTNEVSERSRRRVVFICLVPAAGLYKSALGSASDLARDAMSSLMGNRVAAWAPRGNRILTLIYGGIEGVDHRLQRPAEDLRSRTPMKRLATMTELANVLAFLASDAAGYVTGTSVRVDGGWGAYSWMYPVRTF